jgi:hypothetical protein
VKAGRTNNCSKLASDKPKRPAGSFQKKLQQDHFFSQHPDRRRRKLEGGQEGMK